MCPVVVPEETMKKEIVSDSNEKDTFKFHLR